MYFVNASGRIVARRPSALEHAERYAESVRKSRRSDTQRAMVRGVLLPMLDQMRIEHGAPEAEVYGVALRSAFVPPSRVGSFARGLTLGFDADFALAAHLLLPQFEHALRTLVEARGAVVSTLESDGTQKELVLDPLLESPEAEAILGKQEARELRELLTDRSGVNLRNRVAHGLLEDGEATEHLAYFWWKVLRYCVVGTCIESSSGAPEGVDPPEPPAR